jgi:asparagine synthase (glutamine-hydrolysing)
MCGIAAICSQEEPIDRQRLVAATDILHHRGPDARGYWLDQEGLVGLGHTRLSIVDLAGGQQPMANEDGSVRAVVNGEFYDYRRIQDELRHRGHRLASRSDSEILLHLYEEEGPTCVRHLRGEFAFVLWDARRRRLFAARDRFGIKPLFYARVGGRLVLGSEIKALFAAGVPAAWDEESCHQALFFFPARDRSLFRDVRQVPPGHLLQYGDGTLRVDPYWTLDYPADVEIASEGADNGHAPVEQLNRVRELLEESTRLRLDADVPVSCLLSGGIDSAALLGIASRGGATPVVAFTGVFPTSDEEEMRAARDAARHTGARLELVHVSHEEMADRLPDAVWHAETLGINLHGVARYLLCRQVHAAGHRVALTGEGADELFGGYVHLRQDVEGGVPSAEIPAALAPLRDRLGFVPAWLRAIAVRQSIFHAVLARDYLERCPARDVFTTVLDDVDVERRLRGRSPLVQSLYLWITTILPTYILFSERLEMAHAVEVRLPYLDHVLFEHVRALPPAWLLRAGREKHALREAVRGYVPDAIYRRAKQPFLAPPLTGTDGPLRDLVRDELRSGSMAALPFFDRESVLALEESLPRMAPTVRAALDAALLKIVCAALLQRHFKPTAH